MNKSKKRAFTLIELMVVVAIIAILTAVIIANIYSARGKARDAKRVSDISQIQLALEQYFDKNRAYPSATSDLVTGSVKYISVLPTDPLLKTNYDYKTNDSSNLDYVLHTRLEYPNGAIGDGLSADPYPYTNPAGLTCQPTSTTNPTWKDYCIGPK